MSNSAGIELQVCGS